jgi:aminopeptidase N
VYPDFLPWWWSARIDFFDPHGEIDIPVYEGQDADTYKYIVYFNGAHFVQDIRARIGDEAFFAFLQDYYLKEKGQITTGDDFFRILNEHTDMNYSDIMRKYFKSR